MDNYDEKLNYSFEPADPAPAEPAQPLQQAKEEIRRSGRHTGLKIAALLTVVAIVAAAGGYALKQAIDALGQKNLAEQQTSVDAMAEQTVEPEPAAETAAQPTDDKGAYRLERRPLPDTLPSNDTGKTLTPTQVYQMNVGAVCGIATQVTTNVWGQTTTSACTGSGFVLTEDGYIVTNNHVVADASEGSIVVQLYSGEEYPAAIVGTDSMNDVALLKIEAEGLQTVTIGDSDQIEVGETVEAIGNPLGELTFTMTAGYISALDREITPDRTPINMLQTDVAINAGNSGGPLFDMDGNVIGMTTAKVSGTTESGVSIEGLGFAIPINDVMRVVYDLQLYGRVLGRAYLGVTLQDLDSEVAATYNLPAGPQIVTVTEGSCAETAGLQPRDIILQFEDREISSFTDLSAALAKQKAGDTVTPEDLPRRRRAGDHSHARRTPRRERDRRDRAAGAGRAGGPDRPRHRHPRLRRLRGLRLRLRYGLTQIQNAPPDEGPGARSLFGNFSEDRDDSTVVGVLDVGLHSVGLQGLDQGLDLGAVLLACAAGNDVGVGLGRVAGGVFDGQGVRGVGDRPAGRSCR